MVRETSSGGEVMAKKVVMQARRQGKTAAAKATALIPRGKELPMPKVAPVRVQMPFVNDKGTEGRGLPDVHVNMQSLLERAVDKMVPLDYMEKLIGLLATQRAQWAKERFFEDLALFQAECPIIEKLKAARNPAKKTAAEPEGELLYVYAPYEDIKKVVGPIASRHGFSDTVQTKPFKSEEMGIPMMRATCKIHHRDGHTEETVVEIPIGEGTQRMSPMQKYRGAGTFSKRHAYIDALGLAMKGEDTEYQEDAPGPVAEPQPKAGTVVNKEGVVQATATATKVVSLKQAQTSLQATLDRMEKSKLFSEKELAAHLKYGQAHGEDASKLEDINLDWTAEIAERESAKKQSQG
jgi:hypothetical protein